MALATTFLTFRLSTFHVNRPLHITHRRFSSQQAFYTRALAPLRARLVTEFESAAGFGLNGKGELWLRAASETQKPLHLAFHAQTRSQVNEFHLAALAAGGTDHGPPGLRPIYHPNYYGAYIIDPDGNNIEAVCHAPCWPIP